MKLSKEQQQQMGIICNLVMQINGKDTTKTIQHYDNFSGEETIVNFEYVNFNIQKSFLGNDCSQLELRFFEKPAGNYGVYVYLGKESDVSIVLDMIIVTLNSILNCNEGVLVMSCWGVQKDG